MASLRKHCRQTGREDTEERGKDCLERLKELSLSRLHKASCACCRISTVSVDLRFWEAGREALQAPGGPATLRSLSFEAKVSQHPQAP